MATQRQEHQMLNAAASMQDHFQFITFDETKSTLLCAAAKLKPLEIEQQNLKNDVECIDSFRTTQLT